MSSINNYKVEFVQRTKDLLETNFIAFKEKDKEVTFLLNCLLGLILTVSESSKFIGILKDDFIDFIPDKFGFLVKGHTQNNDLANCLIKKIEIKVGHKAELKNCQKQWLVQKLRNGIAHQNIEAINENNVWKGVKIFNVNNDKVKDFEIIFTIEQLKALAIKIADDYITKTKKIV